MGALAINGLNKKLFIYLFIYLFNIYFKKVSRVFLPLKISHLQSWPIFFGTGNKNTVFAVYICVLDIYNQLP